MIKLPFLAVVLGVMAVVVIVCLTGVFVLVASLKTLPQATAKDEHAVGLDDTHLVAIRIRAGLAGGILGFAGLVLICATVITCIYVRYP
jgi:hypothetical protein